MTISYLAAILRCTLCFQPICTTLSTSLKYTVESVFPQEEISHLNPIDKIRASTSQSSHSEYQFQAAVVGWGRVVPLKSKVWRKVTYHYKLSSNLSSNPIASSAIFHC